MSSDHRESRAATPEWRRRRREVLRRDDFTCQDCGAEVGDIREGGKPAEVHHLTPVDEGGTDEIENLTTLCRGCHNERHKTARLEDVLDLFDEVEGPTITSSDIAEEFDITTEAARQKLARLVERGDLVRRKSGRTMLYWRSNQADTDE